MMTSTTGTRPDPTAPDARVLRRDTRLCMSLSGRPSNIGTRFHNYLYDALGLDYVYKAFTTTDLPAAIAGIRALDIRGRRSLDAVQGSRHRH